MAAAQEVLAAGRTLWSVAIAPGSTVPPCLDEPLRDVVGRFAWLTGPAGAAWLLDPLAARVPALADREAAERARQLSRFMRAESARWLREVADVGLEVVAMKGFASASRIYPDPALRAMSDVDLLVRPGDVARLCSFLVSRGFRFVMSSGTPRWGLANESSFHPLVAPDGTISFDVHAAADDYPVPRTLSVDDVFIRARRPEAEDTPVPIPCDDHLVLLAITHAGRDKFGPAAIRAVTDLVVALARAGLRPDWDAILGLARAGGFAGAVTVAANLLAGLGVARDLLPGAALRPFRGLAGIAFDAILADHLSLFATRPTRLAMQARDWALISSLRTLVHRNWRRAVGLVRPWPGVPEGFSLAR